MVRARDQLNSVMDSIVKTIQLSYCEKNVGVPENTLLQFDLNTFEPSLDYSVPITFLVHGDSGNMLSTCLSVYWRPPTDSEDILSDRIRNAVVLLSQADQVQSVPIALSLSFAAIEALVCEGIRGPTAEIKEYVSTLLVQDGDKRRARQRLLDDLYRIRCDVLHGRKVHGTSNAYDIVRKVAAGLLRAVSCWREHHQRMGWAATWKELMDEVVNASRKPDIVVGIPDLSELIPERMAG
jgi:hypothetical protein